MLRQQQQPLHHVFVTNVHPELTPEFLRRTFKDICEEDPVRVELFRLKDETMLTAVIAFSQKQAQLAAVLLDGVVVGKKAGCPIFIIPEDGPDTFLSIIPQNNATFVSSSPASDFSSFLFSNIAPAPSSSSSSPSSPTPVHVKGVPSNPTITPKPTPTSIPTPTPATPKQAVPTTIAREPIAKPSTPTTPTPTPTKQQTPTIYSLDQSFIPPNLLATLQSTNANSNNGASATPKPTTTTTTPRQTPDKELESLKKSLVLDVVNFNPEGNDTTNTKEKVTVAAVNNIITSYKPEISEAPVPIHLMKPASTSTPTSNATTPSSSNESVPPTDSTPSETSSASTEASTSTESKSASEQAAVSVPSAKNIWNWATTVFHDFLQENLEDYELSRWGVFFFERTKARIPAKLSVEHQRQYLRPLIGRIDHDFYSRGQGREQTYHLYWALYDILLCRMYGEATIKSESEATAEENVDETECKKIMTEIGKIPQLVQANIRIYHLEQSLNRHDVPPVPAPPVPTPTEVTASLVTSEATEPTPTVTPAPTPSAMSIPVPSTATSSSSTSAIPNSEPAFSITPSFDNLNNLQMNYNVIDLFTDLDNINEDEVKRTVEKELIARYFQSITEGSRSTPTAIAEFKAAVDQISAKSAANIELLRTRQSLRTQTEFSFDVSVPLSLANEHYRNLIPLITHNSSANNNNNCLIM